MRIELNFLRRQIYIFFVLFCFWSSLIISMDNISDILLNRYNAYLIENKQKSLSTQVVVKRENNGIVLVADILFSCSATKKSIKTLLLLAAIIPDNSTTLKIEECRFPIENILFCHASLYKKNNSIFYQVAYNPTVITDDDTQKDTLPQHIIECGFSLFSKQLQSSYQYPLFLDIGPENTDVNLIKFISLPRVLQAILQASNNGSFSEGRKAIHWKDVTLPTDYKKFNAHTWNPYRKATSFESMPEWIRKLCHQKFNEQNVS